MYIHTQLADRWKEHNSLVTELNQSNISMLQKYRSKAIKSGLTNIDILEAAADDVTKEILRVADKENIDTIIIGSRGLKAHKEFLLGSVSYKISHYSKCPVIIVR